MITRIDTCIIIKKFLLQYFDCGPKYISDTLERKHEICELEAILNLKGIL